MAASQASILPRSCFVRAQFSDDCSPSRFRLWRTRKGSCLRRPEELRRLCQSSTTKKSTPRETSGSSKAFHQFRVNLVWTDPPHALGGSKPAYRLAARSTRKVGFCQQKQSATAADRSQPDRRS